MEMFRDARIGDALRKLHELPGDRWTVAALASAVGMSRSVFAQRFKQLTGLTPMEYLTSCRIRNAIQLMQESDRKLLDVALSVGYANDGAFNKAFRRFTGVPPGKYRRAYGANRR